MSKHRRKNGLWRVYKDEVPTGTPKPYNEVEEYAQSVRDENPGAQIDVVRVR